MLRVKIFVLSVEIVSSRTQYVCERICHILRYKYHSV